MASSHLSVEELVEDPSFVSFILGRSDADPHHWEAQLRADPSLKERAHEAADIVKAFHATQNQLSDDRIDQLWNDLSSRLDQG